MFICFPLAYIALRCPRRCLWNLCSTFFFRETARTGRFRHRSPWRSDRRTGWFPRPHEFGHQSGLSLSTSLSNLFGTSILILLSECTHLLEGFLEFNIPIRLLTSWTFGFELFQNHIANGSGKFRLHDSFAFGHFSGIGHRCLFFLDPLSRLFYPISRQS